MLPHRDGVRMSLIFLILNPVLRDVSQDSCVLETVREVTVAGRDIPVDIPVGAVWIRFGRRVRCGDVDIGGERDIMYRPTMDTVIPSP